MLGKNGRTPDVMNRGRHRRRYDGSPISVKADQKYGCSQGCWPYSSVWLRSHRQAASPEGQTQDPYSYQRNSALTDDHVLDSAGVVSGVIITSSPSP
jgi:hypothetical protein